MIRGQARWREAGDGVGSAFRRSSARRCVSGVPPNGRCRSIELPAGVDGAAAIPDFQTDGRPLSGSIQPVVMASRNGHATLDGQAVVGCRRVCSIDNAAACGIGPGGQSWPGPAQLSRHGHPVCTETDGRSASRENETLLAPVRNSNGGNRLQAGLFRTEDRRRERRIPQCSKQIWRQGPAALFDKHAYNICRL